MTALIQQLLTRFRPHRRVHRYCVTPRQNACVFRRALLREAIRELQCDPAFATLPAQRNR